MRHALGQESWKNLLPDAYDWLSKVAVASVSTAVAGAHHIVAVLPPASDSADTAADGKEAKLRLSAPGLDDARLNKLADTATALGWRPGAGPLHISLDGTNFTLVSIVNNRAPDLQKARQFGLDAARATKELKLSHVALCAPANLQAAQVLDGYLAGFYATTSFKGTRKKDITKFPANVSVVSAAGSILDATTIKNQVEMSKAQLFTRFLQDAPANYLDPIKFGEIAETLAKDSGLKHKILNKAQMQELGMGSFLSVADGSVLEPRTIVIEIDGQDNSRCVSLVGKGLTFDTGGISIKPAAGMEEMKYDMSGGAAVLGAAHFFAKVKPPVKVVCIIAATENMPSGSATKPGDLVRAMNGKTIEVLNTDAEGRLVLADVLHYAAVNYKPDLMIDIATLTGAVLYALGCAGAALMTNDQATGDFVMKSAEAVGEPLWQLPLWPEMDKEVKGDVGDLKNIAKGNVKGGTIIGGVFLKEFVGDRKWVHLDIAGTGWNCLATGYPSGGSAFGLRTMVSACQRFGS